MQRNAFLMRVKPGRTESERVDRTQECLSENVTLIGWADAPGLLEKGLSCKELGEIIARS